MTFRPAREREIEQMIVSDTMLGRAASLEDVGNVAAFVAAARWWTSERSGSA
jgi:hypothetical protein